MRWFHQGGRRPDHQRRGAVQQGGERLSVGARLQAARREETGDAEGADTRRRQHRPLRRTPRTPPDG